jgi:uncharacterized glyoxalase superfamily protein PhnB
MKNSNQQLAGKTNRSMPPGVVIPELAYADVRKAVDWLCQTFGFKERLRIGNHRAQLAFGEGSVIVTHRPVDPNSPSSGTSNLHTVTSVTSGIAIMVRVTDADSHFQHVRLSGARIINPPTDHPYGERQYTAEDIGGYQWTFSQTIADVDPGVWGGSLVE